MSKAKFKPLQSILLATDFSPASEHARDVAAMIAARTGATIHALHVCIPFIPDYPYAHVLPVEMTDDSDIKAAARSSLEDFLKPVTGATELHVLREFSPAQATTDLAVELDIDLIVIGSAGARGLARLFLGSVASEVVRLARTSTLVVGPKHAPSADGFNNILATVDFSESSILALQQAADLAMLHDARFTALHVVDSSPLPPYFTAAIEHDIQDAARLRLEKLVAELDMVVTPDLLVSVGRPHSEIPETARSLDTDLIVMGTQGLSGLEDLLIGSVTARVLRDSPCPVLAHRGGRASSL